MSFLRLNNQKSVAVSQPGQQYGSYQSPILLYHHRCSVDANEEQSLEFVLLQEDEQEHTWDFYNLNGQSNETPVVEISLETD